MKRVLFTVNEVKEMIDKGKTLVLAGESHLLRQLPAGNWIGGTIPYFMAESGGVIAKEQIFVTEMPSFISGCAIKTYTGPEIADIYQDPKTNGFSIVIIPSGSQVHLNFALNAPGFEGFATRPLIGWISGTHLDDLGRLQPEVFSGINPQPLSDAAVVMHVSLAETKYAEIKIINIFTQGAGDQIFFPNSGFSAATAIINGEERNFAEYLQENQIDTKMPLVANYSGAMINTSFKGIDPATRTVSFFAPVFEGILYKLANPVTDYVACFNRQLVREDVGSICFSCNCILNFLYSELEGKQTGAITGPITFGEIAYQLLNQTLVYLTVNEIKS